MDAMSLHNVFSNVQGQLKKIRAGGDTGNTPLVYLGLGNEV